MSAVNDLKQELSTALRYYSHGGKRGGRYVQMKTLPMVTDKVWRGIPLRRAMTPPVPSTGAETEQLFDTWMWPVKNGEGESTEDLHVAGGSTLHRYVTKGADFGECTVRLLHALSNADGASLVYDDKAVMVHHDTRSYGIIDGKAFSHFCDGTPVTVDHQKILTESRRVKVVTREFCYLWNEAYLRRENLVEPLVALWQSEVVVQWGRLVHQPPKQKWPNGQHLEKWLCMIDSQAPDPLWALYTTLVPKWMTKTTYTSVFGKVTTRKQYPDDVDRQVFMNKLCNWYTKRHWSGEQ